MRLIVYCAVFVNIFVQFKAAVGDYKYNHIEGLNEVLQRTEKFFTNLKSEFKSYPQNAKTRHSIDIKFNQFLRDVGEEGKVNVTEGTGEENSHQQKYEQDYDTLDTFKVVPKWDLPNSMDVIFIQLNSKDESAIFVLALKHDGVSLLQLERTRDEFIEQDFYPMSDGVSIVIVKNLTEPQNILVAVRETTDYTVILRLNHDATHNALKFHHIQTLLTPGANHLDLWYGMDDVLYLGITSRMSITIYSWRTRYNFELHQQMIYTGARKLIPLRINETHAVNFATAGSTTRIFNFHSKFNRYNLMQSLGESIDIVNFHIHQGRERYKRNFIVMVRNESMIIYNNYHHLFVPFQQLELDEIGRVYSFVQDQTVYVLFVPTQLSRGIKVFTYNGWKFVDTQINMRSYAIEKFTGSFLHVGQWHVAVKIENDGGRESTWRVLRMNLFGKKETDWCDEVMKNERVATSDEMWFESHSTNQIHHNDTNTASATNKFLMAENMNRWKNELKELLETKMSIKHITIDILNKKNVRALSQVFSEDVKSKSIDAAVQNLIQQNKDQHVSGYDYELRNVTIQSNVNYFCPIPAVNFEHIKVDGLINGIVTFENWMNDLLKVNGNNGNDSNCQIITGAHQINNVETINANFSSVGIGFNLTHQNIIASNITIDELEIISGGLFLPINHTGICELTGTLSVNRAKVMELIELNGHINGTGVAHLLPIVHYQQPIILNQHSNRHFNHVQIIESLIANDIIGFQAKHSVNLMKSNSLPLNSFNIPTHMTFKMMAVDWNDVYISESLGNWLTVRNSKTFNITGLKMISPRVQLSPKGHEIVSVSTFENPICTLAAYSDDVYTSSITVDRARVQKLNADAIIGGSILDDIDIRRDKTDFNKAKKIDAPEFYSANWIGIGVMRGPVKLANLTVQNVNSHGDVVLPLPQEIETMVAKKKCFIDNINGVDVNHFMNDVVTVDDQVTPLAGLQFDGGLEVNEIIALDEPIDFSNNGDDNFDFGAKTVAGKIESRNVNISFIPAVAGSNDKVDNSRNESAIDLIVSGNVTFMMEPRIQKMNNWTVKNLLDDVWMKNRPTMLKGTSMNFSKMVVDGGPIDIKHSLNTPEYGEKHSWNEFSETIVSRSKIQNISQMCKFDRVYVLNDIIGSEKSRIIPQMSTNLYNLQHHTLQKCRRTNGTEEKFVVVNNWEFRTIHSTGSVEINGKVNNFDLNKDVVRTDVEENIIRATKDIDNLIVNNISNYTKFKELVKNTLMTNVTKSSFNATEKIIVDGKKQFETVKMMNLTVNGEIAGKKIEQCVQKKKKLQYFRGRKIIKGPVTAYEILTKMNIIVHDIDLMNSWRFHLKKKFNGTQIIANSVKFERGLKIFGSAKIDGRYGSIPMSDYGSRNVEEFSGPLITLKRRIGQLHEITGKILDVSSNHMIHWDKLELVDAGNFVLDHSASLTIPSGMEASELIHLENLGDCVIREVTLICNNYTVTMNLSSVFNTSNVIQFEMLSINNVKLLVVITAGTGGVAIFSYVPKFKKFELKMNLDVPDILHGSIEQAHNSIWITLDVRDRTILLRYDTWSELQQYILPPSPQTDDGCDSQFIRIPHSVNEEELLFIRNDGIWRTGGLSQPKRIMAHNSITCPVENVFFANSSLYFELTNVKNNRANFLRARWMSN